MYIGPGDIPFFSYRFILPITTEQNILSIFSCILKLLSMHNQFEKKVPLTLSAVLWRSNHVLIHVFVKCHITDNYHMIAGYNLCRMLNSDLCDKKISLRTPHKYRMSEIQSSRDNKCQGGVLQILSPLQRVKLHHWIYKYKRTLVLCVTNG